MQICSAAPFPSSSLLGWLHFGQHTLSPGLVQICQGTDSIPAVKLRLDSRNLLPFSSWLGLTQHHGRLTPSGFPASQSFGTHPAHALAMGHSSRIPRGKLWCTARSSHHMLVGPWVTRMGHRSQFTVSLASPGQTPEAQLTSS